MGIDRSNVRFVVHASAPRSPEHYQQEAGRAGRDGLPAECVLIYSGSDFVRWRQMLEQNGEFTESARALLRDMERYAAGTRCRHRALVEYFGETLDSRDECGACDWCLQGARQRRRLDDAGAQDPVVRRARAAGLRAWRTSPTCCSGRPATRSCSTGHAELSTFGLLKQESAAAVRGYIEQLVAGGWLAREGEPYPVLRLTASGAALLKGEGQLRPVSRAAAGEGQEPARAGPGAASFGGDPELFDRLREVRTRLARERGVPPYVIFHDTTLRQMAERRPQTIDDLHDIYGVGVKKAADFGDAFLDAIRLYAKPD